MKKLLFVFLFFFSISNVFADTLLNNIWKKINIFDNDIIIHNSQWTDVRVYNQFWTTLKTYSESYFWQLYKSIIIRLPNWNYLIIPNGDIWITYNTTYNFYFYYNRTSNSISKYTLPMTYWDTCSNQRAWQRYIWYNKTDNTILVWTRWYCPWSQSFSPIFQFDLNTYTHNDTNTSNLNYSDLFVYNGDQNFFLVKDDLDNYSLFYYKDESINAMVCFTELDWYCEITNLNVEWLSSLNINNTINKQYSNYYYSTLPNWCWFYSKINKETLSCKLIYNNNWSNYIWLNESDIILENTFFSQTWLMPYINIYNNNWLLSIIYQASNLWIYINNTNIDYNNLIWEVAPEQECSIFDYNCDGEVWILNGEFLQGLWSWIWTPFGYITDYITKIKNFIWSFQDIYTTEERTIWFFQFTPKAEANFNPLDSLPSENDKNIMTDMMFFWKAYVWFIFFILWLVAFIALNRKKNE